MTKDLIKPKPELIIDIETSPIIAAVWQVNKPTVVGPENILQDWYIISASYKFKGKKKVYNINLLQDAARFKANPCDDYFVCEKLHELLMRDDIDIIVGHNVRGFDMKKINTRFIYHGMAPIPHHRTADTLSMARESFKFSSNKLDYILKFLGLDAKMSTPKGLWLRALQGCRKAIKTMVKYNNQDILISEVAYDKLRPWSRRAPTQAPAYINDTEDKLICPACSGTNLQKRGTSVLSSGIYQRYQCQGKGDKASKDFNACGKWSRGKRNLITKKNTGFALADKLTVQ